MPNISTLIASLIARLAKGPQVGANSVSVTLATDETLGQFPPFLGEQDISASLSIAPGTRSVFTTGGSLVAVAPPVSTSAYTAGNVVGGVMTFAAVLGPRGLALLRSVRVACKSTQSDNLTLWLFSASPSASTLNDKAAPNINIADFSKLVASYTLTPASGLGTHTIWAADKIDKMFSGAASGSIYAVLTRAGTTAFGTVSDIDVALSFTNI
jgi:hypothetical protein